MELRRVVLLTGAGSGIGAAAARRLAAPDTGLLLTTRRNADGLARAVEAARDAGSPVESATADLAEASAAARLVALAERRFGRLDQLVSNAGFADRTPVAALDDAGFAASHEAIIGALFRLARAAAPLLTRSPRGRIVAVSSFVAHRVRAAGNTFPASAAAKAGLEGLARALAAELAGHRVTVNCVVPGYIEKDNPAFAAVGADGMRQAVPAIPFGRLGQPDDVAAAIAFLLSDDAAYVTGQALHVDGGLGL